jgi:hypothetical protein
MSNHTAFHDRRGGRGATDDPWARLLEDGGVKLRKLLELTRRGSTLDRST